MDMHLKSGMHLYYVPDTKDERNIVLTKEWSAYLIHKIYSKIIEKRITAIIKYLLCESHYACIKGR